MERGRREARERRRGVRVWRVDSPVMMRHVRNAGTKREGRGRPGDVRAGLASGLRHVRVRKRNCGREVSL